MDGFRVARLLRDRYRLIKPAQPRVSLEESDPTAIPVSLPRPRPSQLASLFQQLGFQWIFDSYNKAPVEILLHWNLITIPHYHKHLEIRVRPVKLLRRRTINAHGQDLLSIFLKDQFAKTIGDFNSLLVSETV